MYVPVGAGKVVANLQSRQDEQRYGWHPRQDGLVKADWELWIIHLPYLVNVPKALVAAKIDLERRQPRR